MYVKQILRIFHGKGLYPYHLTPVQDLLPIDQPARVQFFRFILDQQNESPMFLNKILFTDKVTFTRRGVFNFRNKHA